MGKQRIANPALREWIKKARDYGVLHDSWTEIKMGSEQHRSWLAYFGRNTPYALRRLDLNREQSWTAPCEWPEDLPFRCDELPSSGLVEIDHWARRQFEERKAEEERRERITEEQSAKALKIAQDMHERIAREEAEERKSTARPPRDVSNPIIEQEYAALGEEPRRTSDGMLISRSLAKLLEEHKAREVAEAGQGKAPVARPLAGEDVPF